MDELQTPYAKQDGEHIGYATTVPNNTYTDRQKVEGLDFLNSPDEQVELSALEKGLLGIGVLGFVAALAAPALAFGYGAASAFTGTPLGALSGGTEAVLIFPTALTGAYSAATMGRDIPSGEKALNIALFAKAMALDNVVGYAAGYAAGTVGQLVLG